MSIKLAAFTFISVLMAPFIWFQLTRGNFSYDLLDSILLLLYPPYSVNSSCIFKKDLSAMTKVFALGLPMFISIKGLAHNS